MGWDGCRRERGRMQLITCKAYSGVSSEAMGPNDGSIWLCVRGCVRISVEALRTQMTEVNRSPTKWKARGLSSERGSTIALSFGCTIVLCSDLLKVKCPVANYNVALQEWTERRPRQHYTPCGVGCCIGGSGCMSLAWPCMSWW
jgi:hypothetical protein